MNAIKNVFALGLFFALIVTFPAHSQAAGSLGGSGIGGISNRLPPHVGVGNAPYAWRGQSLDTKTAAIAADADAVYFVSNGYRDANGDWRVKEYGRVAGVEIDTDSGIMKFLTSQVGMPGTVVATSPVMTASINGVDFSAALTTLGGSLNMAGNLISVKACAAGFARLTPNYCIRNTDTTPIALANNACTNIPNPAGSSGVFALVIRTYSYAIGANVANTPRFATVTQHFGGSCAGAGNVLADARGYESTAAFSVGVGSDSSQSTVLTGGGALIKLARDAGTLSTASYAVIGYYD